MRIMVGRRWCSKHGHSQDLESKDSWLRMNKNKIKVNIVPSKLDAILVIWIISNGFKKRYSSKNSNFG